MVPEDDARETAQAPPIRSLARPAVRCLYISPAEEYLWGQLTRRFLDAGLWDDDDPIICFDINAHGVTAVHRFGTLDTLPWDDD